MRAIKSKFPYVLFILDPCSHCYLSQGATDGPCKVSKKHNFNYCINQADNLYCSTSQSEYERCEKQGITNKEISTCVQSFHPKSSKIIVL